MTGPADDDVVSRDTMSRVRHARTRAKASPTAEELAAMLTDASRREDLSADDISRLGSVAIRQARQVSYLLGKLAGLLGETGEDVG